MEVYLHLQIERGIGRKGVFALVVWGSHLGSPTWLSYYFVLQKSLSENKKSLTENSVAIMLYKML